MEQILKIEWWKAAGLRAFRTFCQTLVGAISTTAVLLSDVNWSVAISTSALAALLSLITSVAGLPELELKEAEEVEKEGE